MNDIMENEFRDLVFSNNSTTFQTLSELNVTDMNTIISAVETNTQNITSNTDGIVLLNEQLTALGLTVQNYQTANNAHFVTLDTQIIDINDKLITVNLDIDNLNTDVANLTTTVDTMQTQVTELSTQVDTLSSNVSTLQTQLEAQAELITTMQTSISSLETAQGVQAGQITNLESDVSLLQSTQGIMNGKIETLQSQVSTLQGDINTLQNDLFDVRVKTNNWYDDNRHDYLILRGIPYWILPLNGNPPIQAQFNGTVGDPISYGSNVTLQFIDGPPSITGIVYGIGRWYTAEGTLKTSSDWAIDVEGTDAIQVNMAWKVIP